MNKTYIKWWLLALLCTMPLVIPCALMPHILSHFDQPGSWLQSTDFGKSDLLNFYASFFTFLGTIALGVATVFLSQQANNMNKRLLKIEENNYIPFVDINGLMPEEMKEYCLNDVFFINMDDCFTDISDEMEIIFDDDADDGLALILAMTNVSKTDIINIELHQMSLKVRYAPGISVPLSYDHLSVSLNNKVSCHGTIPFIISGIKFPDSPPEDMEAPENAFADPIIGATLEFHNTNYLGEIYVQKIKFDLIALWDGKVNYPAVENKRNLVLDGINKPAGGI